MSSGRIVIAHLSEEDADPDYNTVLTFDERTNRSIGPNLAAAFPLALLAGQVIENEDGTFTYKMNLMLDESDLLIKAMYRVAFRPEFEVR